MTLFTEPTIDTSVQPKVFPATYWNNNGLYQEFYESNSLVPNIGAAGTIEGEMLRAAGRLYYDFYNNGMCNNTSGAANFLMKCNSDLKLGISAELKEVHAECNSGCYTTEELSEPLESIVNSVLEYIINQDGNYTVTELDMLDYADEYDDEEFMMDDEDEDQE